MQSGSIGIMTIAAWAQLLLPSTNLACFISFDAVHSNQVKRPLKFYHNR